MKKVYYYFFVLSLALSSCSEIEVPFNEVNGSYFFHENTTVIFEDIGYLTKDPDGNLAIACFTKKHNGRGTDCVTIIIPKDRYTLDDNRMDFRKSFDTSFRFCTYAAIMHIHLQQETKVHIKGAIINDTENDFFHEGNVYSCPVSLSFSLEDGSDIRLEMNTITMINDSNLYTGWL